MLTSTRQRIAIVALIGLLVFCVWALFLRATPPQDSFPERVYALAFAGVPPQFVMLGSQGLVRLGSSNEYQLENDTELAPSKRVGWAETTVQEFNKRTVWSDDASWLAFQNGDAVEIWRTDADPERTAVLEGAGRDLKIMHLSGDGNTLITDQADPAQGRQVWLLNDEGKPEPQGKLPAEGALLAVNFDGTLVAITTAQQIELIDVLSGAAVRSIAVPGSSPADVIAFSPDGELVAATAGAQPRPEVWVWKLSDGTLYSSLDKYDDPIISLAFSPNSAQLAAGGGAENSDAPVDAKVWVWHLRGDSIKTLGGEPRPKQTGPAARIVFHPNGRLLMALTNDGQLRLWTDPIP